MFLITAPCVSNVGLAIEHIYPLVSDYKMDRPETITTKPGSGLHLLPRNRQRRPGGGGHRQYTRYAHANNMDSSEEEDSDFDSDDSEI